ncbi:uncharacterized protein LOC123673618 [Harmonia axyridis]|uniref:uncharacterized protein LOC123673618 n=1 Tax=Harmonia axyridis TaxID=115357 RepID=UPI001E2795A6|nr:uncharacterized protein LOC123673618 [Harmonia axyridis]
MATKNIDFDMEEFISEIERYPAIWDMRSDLHSNRLEKSRAWEKVCLKFIDGYENKSSNEKNAGIYQLQRKWRSLRDCYNRDRNKARTIGPKGLRRRKYIYFDQLSFLSSSTEGRSESEEGEQESITLQSYSVQRSSPVDCKDTIKKYKTMANVEKAEIELVDNTSSKEMDNQNDKTDSDRSFLLSLLSDFNCVKEDFKLDLKIEMLSLLKKYKNLNNQQYINR